MTIGSAATPIAFIYVTDQARGVAFYRDVLGLTMLNSDGFGEVFTIGSSTLRIVPIPDHKPGEHPVIGWEVPDMDAAADALAAKGITFAIYPGFGQDERGIWTAPDSGKKLAWFADPDGNVLMLAQN
jgi:catechol 2,3-dioxygenase-like lactoylglutathione lyase family enzyme